MSPLLRVGFAVVMSVSAIGPGLAWGQPAAGAAGSDQAVATPPRTEKTLNMFVRVKKLTEADIRDTLEAGLRQSGCSSGPITVRPVSSDVYAMLSGSAVPTALPSVSPDAGEGSIGRQPRRIPSTDNLWELPVDRNHVVTEGTVTFLDGTSVTLEPTTVEQLGEEGLVPTMPGRYTLRLADDRGPPTEYSLKVAYRNKPGTDKIDAQKFPEMSRAMMVTLPQFRGDQNRLFETVQNPKMVANPFSEVALGEEHLFIFASLDGGPVKPGDSFDGNLFVTSALGIPGRQAARVWMRFPLTEQQAREETQRLNALDRKEIPATIRREGAVPANESLVVTANNEPRWFELPPRVAGGNDFTRAIALSNFRGLAEAFPSAHKVLVWEFESPTGDLDVIRIENREGQSANALEEEILVWPSHIRGMAAAERNAEAQPSAKDSPRN